jgi:exodeoxyribonuclease VII small subunit
MTKAKGEARGRAASDADLEPELGFEAAYRQLEEAVAALEQGDLPLDECLALYERGAALAARCGALLAAAELKLRQVDGEGRDAGEVVL